MNVPRLLLFTSTPPGDGSVGEVYLRDLCIHYPVNKLSVFAIPSPGITVTREWKNSPSLTGLPIEIANWSGYKRRVQKIGGVLPAIIGSLEFAWARSIESRLLLKQAVKFGRKNRVEMVWAVLGSPMMYLLAASLASELGVPLITTVWDPIERIVRDFHLGGKGAKIAGQYFAQALRASKRTGVMSEGMRDEYSGLYNAECVIIRHGIDEERNGNPQPRRASPNELVIGYGGSLYALDEWSALIGALESVGWRLDERKVRIVVYGSHVRTHTPESALAHIEFKGWRPMDEVREGLSSVDVNYLPYWFDEAHGPDVRLCFPTKLTTYLATGTPVFYHGPKNSSPVKFFEQFPAAVMCHSLRVTDILESLKDIVRDEGNYARMVAATDSAMLAELNGHVFRERFAELIGITPDALT